MRQTKRKQLTSAICGLSCASQKRLLAYQNHLMSDRDPKIFDDRMKDVLLNFATDTAIISKTMNYLDSIGFNQSKYEYAKIVEQLRRFGCPNHPKFSWNKNFKAAKQALLNEVRSFNCSVLEYTPVTIPEYIPKLSTHAGFSYILTGMRKKKEYVEGMYESYMHEENLALKRGTFGKPILLGARTQASGAFDHEGQPTGTFKSKTRMVSMIDIYQIMAERRFQKPIQSKLTAMGWYAGGKSDHDLMSIINYRRGIFNHWTSIDYSSYDQTISDWLIREAFDIIRAMFKPFNQREESLFQVIIDDFINKMFVIGPNDTTFSEKGVPSGSMFTQIIDSLVNRLMIDTYLIAKDIGISNNTRSMIIMGDDNLIFTRKKLDLEDLSSYLSRNFGIICNPDKCGSGVSTPPEFLSRVWDYRIYRDPQVLISKLLYPENFREYDRLGEDPTTIILQYYDNFPAGISRIIDNDDLRRIVTYRESSGKHYGSYGDKFLTGLARYRAMFENRV